jgi:hypothetical protein
MAENEDLDVTQQWYISGPMRGVTDFNFPRFRKAAEYIRTYGNDVWSPHEAFGGRQDHPLVDYLKEDLPALLEATDVAFLPGWQNSEGSRVEFLIAKMLGLTMHLVFFAQKEGSDEYVFDVVGMLDENVPPELEASSIVRNGERETIYGPPLKDFRRTADQWASLGIGTSQDPADVALAMTALKMSRLKGTRGHYDSIVDAIGYLICYSRIVRES